MKRIFTKPAMKMAFHGLLALLLGSVGLFYVGIAYLLLGPGSDGDVPHWYKFVFGPILLIGIFCFGGYGPWASFKEVRANYRQWREA